MTIHYFLETNGDTAGDYGRELFSSFEEMNDAYRNRAHDGKQYTFEIVEYDFYWRFRADSCIYRPMLETPI